jgi:hypothetical protein
MKPRGERCDHICVTGQRFQEFKGSQALADVQPHPQDSTDILGQN